MRKLNVLLLVLGIAIILTGCDLFGSDESINAQNDIVVINFDSHSAKGMSLNTQYPKVAELYWSYTAEKKDNKPKYGEKLAPANIKDGTGCNKNIEFSTGKWEFVLYGFTTADARTKSNTIELAQKNCTYTGKVEKELKKTDTAVTVCTEVNSNPDTYGTIKVSVTTSPTNSNKTVKYYITNANGYSTTWTSVSGQENTSATDGYTVYLGLFDETGRNVGETSITNIRVDAGLTTEISGTWDVNFIEGGIDIIGPWNVKFESVLGKPVQNQSVKNGECATMPADLTVGEKIRGVIGTIDAIYEFAGWAETENGTDGKVDIEAITITADKTFYAVWIYVSDVPNVWNVKFETRIPNHVIPNQLVTDGNCAETPSDFKVGDRVCVIMGSTHYFWGWSTTITDITEGSLADKTVDVDTIPITTDTTFYAVWGESHTDSKTLLFIDVTVSPIDYVFSEGDVVKEHLIVKGLYSDGLENTITDTDYSTDITTVTSKTNFVTVTYTENSVTKTKTIPITVVSGSGSGITLNDIEVITDTDIFYEGEDIKNHLTVKGVYSDGVKTISDDGYSTNLPNNKVTTTTNSVTITYSDCGETKEKTISIKVFSDIEVTTETNVFFLEGDYIKDFITVKSVYSDGSTKTLQKNEYSTDLIDDKVTPITNTVEISYTEKGVTKTKNITITLGNLLDYEIGNVWFDNFSEVNKGVVTSISFVKEKPSDVTESELVEKVGELSYYKKGSDIYVVGERIVFGFDSSNMFSSFPNVTKINLSNVNTSNVDNMVNMFTECEELTSLDLSSFDTSNVTNMSNMFYGCKKLTSLDISKFITSKVTEMNYMFDNCSQLTSLDLSSFDTSKVTMMRKMFEGCSQLTSLDLSSFDITTMTTDRQSVDTEDMFYGVPTSTPIYVSNVDDWTSIGGWNFLPKP